MIVQIYDDFNLDRIADSGQCFRWRKENDTTYCIIAGKFCLHITSVGEISEKQKGNLFKEQYEGPSREQCKGQYYDLDCTEEEYLYFWRDYFDLQESYQDIRKRIDPEMDPFLWEASEAEKGIRILRQDPWEMLITFIISQNRNIPAICRSVDMLARTCGEKKMDKQGMEYYTFPTPTAVAALTETELADCRLGYRCKYVHAAAKAVVDGTLNLDELRKADDTSALRTLTSLYGVGIKVANCISLFGLHQTNSFPVDVWMKRILAEQYPEGYPYERYAPYNGIFQQYMFAYYRHRV